VVRTHADELLDDPGHYGDRLVGKLDATADRRVQVLRVAAIYQVVPFGKGTTAAVTREIKAFAQRTASPSVGASTRRPELPT
jgi:uncharacterized protein YcaQ